MSHGSLKPNVIIVDQTGTYIPASSASGLMVYFGGGTSLLVGQSGNLSVAVSGGTLPVTQSGPFVVSHSGLVHVSGSFVQSGPFAVQISGGSISTTPPTSITAVSGLVAQSGNWLVGQSGTFAVSVSGGSVASTQSGPWAFSISGGTPFSITQSGPLVVSHSGLCHTSGLVDNAIYVDDADWNALTSRHALVGAVYSVTPRVVTDGDTAPLAIDSNAHLITNTHAAVEAFVDGISNSQRLALDWQGAYISNRSVGYVYNGATWDRMRGTAESGLLVNFGNNPVAVAISGGSISTTPPTSITSVSGLVAQSGNWIIGQSGTFSVAISGGTLPVTQSGPWMVGHSGLAHISGQVTQGGAWVVAHSGLVHVSGAVSQVGANVVSHSGLCHVSGSVVQTGAWVVGGSGNFAISGVITASGTVGNVAHDSPDLGQPVKVGGRAIELLTPVEVASGDRTDFISDTFGRQLTGHIPLQMARPAYSGVNSVLSGTNFISPTTATKRLAVTSLIIGSSGVTSGNLTLWYGASADTTWGPTKHTVFRANFAPTLSGCPGAIVPFTVPASCSGINHHLKVTTNAAVALDISAIYYEW